MWQFIKYCFYCMLLTISAAFGFNPSGLTWKNIIVGALTTIILLALILCIVYLIAFVFQKNK